MRDRMAPEIAAALGQRPKRTRAGARMFTVERTFDESAGNGRGQFVPMIRMRGQWLQKLGFRSGDRMVVEERRGELVVKLARGR